MDKIEKLKRLEEKLSPVIISTFSYENLRVIASIWRTFDKIVTDLTTENANKWSNEGIGSFEIKEKMDYINELPNSSVKSAKSEYKELTDYLLDSIQKIIQRLEENR